jgi:hypothetical protein
MLYIINKFFVASIHPSIHSSMHPSMHLSIHPTNLPSGRSRLRGPGRAGPDAQQTMLSFIGSFFPNSVSALTWVRLSQPALPGSSPWYARTKLLSMHPDASRHRHAHIACNHRASMRVRGRGRAWLCCVGKNTDLIHATACGPAT